MFDLISERGRADIETLLATTGTILVKTYPHGGGDPIAVRRMTVDEICDVVDSAMIHSWQYVRLLNSPDCVHLWLASDFEQQWEDMRSTIEVLAQQIGAAMQPIAEALRGVAESITAQFAEAFPNGLPTAEDLAHLREARDLDSYDAERDQRELEAWADSDPVAASWSGDGSRYTPPEDHAAPGDDLESWLGEVSAMLNEEAD